MLHNKILKDQDRECGTQQDNSAKRKSVVHNKLIQYKVKTGSVVQNKTVGLGQGMWYTPK